jgi:hypothetical protein
MPEISDAGVFRSLVHSARDALRYAKSNAKARLNVRGVSAAMISPAGAGRHLSPELPANDLCAEVHGCILKPGSRPNPNRRSGGEEEETA